MPIVALFESDTDLSPVIEALPAHIDQGDYELLEPDLPTTATQKKPVAVPGPKSGGAAITPPMSSAGEGEQHSLDLHMEALRRAGVPNAERKFFAQSMKDGGKLLVIHKEKEDVPTVVGLLREHGATRIV